MFNGTQAVMQSLYFRQQVEDKPWIGVSQDYCPETLGVNALNPLERAGPGNSDRGISDSLAQATAA
jgi:hypothetical protein